MESAADVSQPSGTSSPRGTPWSFGLRSLFLVVAAIGGQSALIAYLGPLFGLLVGLGLVLSGLAALLATVMVKGRRLAPARMRSLDRVAVILTFAAVGLGIATLAAGGGEAAYRRWQQLRTSRALQEDLGLRWTVRSFVSQKEVVQCLEITAVSGGSIAHQAGLRRQDILISDLDPWHFIEVLDENRGSVIDLRVARGPTLQDLDALTQRGVRLRVPQ